MKKEFVPSLDEILKEIQITEERMKKARLTNDKVGYEIALKRHEQLYKEYRQIIYKKREPTQVFEKRW
jgi:hypothetical protein